MAIRNLTEEELEQIKTAKQAANEKLKGLREPLLKRRRYVTGKQARELDHDLAALSSVGGKPVVVTVEGREIYIDYDIVKKFTKLLDRQKFWYSLTVEGSDSDRRLTIQYHQYRGNDDVNHGLASLYEISSRKRDLLSGFPKVELARLNLK